MLQRKKPLTRKKALRAKKPLRAQAVPGAPDASGEAARKLWPLLANRPGPPFCQVARLGPYVADFYCPAAKLVILLENEANPARQDWFAAQGYRVLGFAAADVNPDTVRDRLAEAFTLRVVKS